MALIDNSTLSLDDWKYVDRLFGLKLVESAPDISDELKEIISKHHNARLEKNYALSDKIREELASKNISILDSADGVIWEYID